mgnify:FL=1|tara:strand:+ start:788 stop:2035 length:1248 start_codon:yes stop_codon:yes gene_type:complete
MESITLQYKGKKIGLRKIRDDLYEPKNSQILENALGTISTAPDSISVLLVVKTVEGLSELLNSIENKMENRKWAFWIADISKEDKSFDIIEHYGIYCSASIFAPLKMAQGYDPILAKSSLEKISSQYDYEFESQICITQECDSENIDLESFSFVCTKELMREGAVFIESVNLFYDLPIYVICDTETKRYFDSLELKNLIFKLDAEEDILKEVKSKHFQTLYSEIKSPHRVECIFQKMAAMDFALSHHRNTFFLDCDIILVDKIDQNLNKEIILSPHYHCIKNTQNSLKYGFFNAGYLFCADNTFPDYWKELYLTRSKFYEQECMNYIDEAFDTGIFDRRHNWGFWRNNFNIPKDMKSFHLHLTDGIYKSKNAGQGIITMNQKIKDVFYKFLDDNLNREEILYLKDKINFLMNEKK